MKYKVGDKVLVRNDLEHNKRYSDVRFDESMGKYRGAQATITRVHEKYKTYEIDLDRGLFMWGDDMFEGKCMEEGYETEYKVGDKVRIRNDLKFGAWYGGRCITLSDKKYIGKAATITDVIPSSSPMSPERYFVDIDDGERWWTGETLEKVEKETSPQKQVEVSKDAANDPVSHPSHYTDGKIEVIDFIQDKHLDFARGNVVKYISRAGKKGGSKEKELEDLKKARQYCDFAIRELEGRK